MLNETELAIDYEVLTMAHCIGCSTPKAIGEPVCDRCKRILGKDFAYPKPGDGLAEAIRKRLKELS